MAMLHLLALTLTVTITRAISFNEPPSIAAGLPPPEYYKTDQEIDLPCVARGNPEPVRTWLHNGKPLNLNQVHIKRTEAGITVTDTGLADQGKYQCVATNQYGVSLSQLFTVNFASLGSFKVTDPPVTPYVQNVGQYLKVIRADIDSIPKPVYVWKTVASIDDTNPLLLTRSNRIIQDLEGNLYFTYLKKVDEMEEDDRFYKVDVFNAVIDSMKGGSYSNIKVTGDASTIAAHSPKLEYPLATTLRQVFIEGKEMKIQCIFSGNPEVAVSWIGPVSGERSEANTILTVEKMSKEAEGEYKCTGTNKHGSDSKNIKVDMQTPPKFTADGKPQPQTLSEGDLATFFCQTTRDTDPPAEIKFMIDAVEVDESDPGRGTEIIPILNGKKMTIRDVKQATDRKVIQCVAENPHGELYVDALLNVLQRTVIEKSPNNQMLDTNTTEILFECKAVSDPTTPVTITWNRDNKPLSYYDDDRMDDKIANLLKLDLTTLNNEKKRAYTGVYTCNATNKYSYKHADATLQWNDDGNTAEIRAAGFPIWIILVIIAGILLLLIFILIICICKQRNKGDEYLVDSKEREHGNNVEDDIADEAFKDFIRRDPEETAGKNMSKASLAGIDSAVFGSTASLDQYDEIHFKEDGSFVGSYMTDRKKIRMPEGSVSNA